MASKEGIPAELQCPWQGSTCATPCPTQYTTSIVLRRRNVTRDPEEINGWARKEEPVTGSDDY